MKLEPRPDWNEAQPRSIPSPTYVPAATAFGILFLAWGVMTSPVVLGVGLAVLVASLVRWIGELRHEQ